MLEYIWPCLRRRRRDDSQVFRSDSEWNQTKGSRPLRRKQGDLNRREATRWRSARGLEAKKTKKKERSDGAMPKAEWSLLLLLPLTQTLAMMMVEWEQTGIDLSLLFPQWMWWRLCRSSGRWSWAEGPTFATAPWLFTRWFPPTALRMSAMSAFPAAAALAASRCVLVSTGEILRELDVEIVPTWSSKNMPFLALVTCLLYSN